MKLLSLAVALVFALLAAPGSAQTLPVAPAPVPVAVVGATLRGYTVVVADDATSAVTLSRSDLITFR